MPQKIALVLRLSPAQNKVVEHLAKKLGLDRTNIIRLAITRLAEAEGVLPPVK